MCAINKAELMKNQNVIIQSLKLTKIQYSNLKNNEQIIFELAKNSKRVLCKIEKSKNFIKEIHRSQINIVIKQ